jgi:hypothetical protein
MENKKDKIIKKILKLKSNLLNYHTKLRIQKLQQELDTIENNDRTTY